MVGADGLARCAWVERAGLPAYHDTEWGRPLHGDDALYERMSLEAFQSGLSWLTILRKRRDVPGRLRRVPPRDRRRVRRRPTSTRLLADAGIVRNRAKIEAAIANARAALELPAGCPTLLWSFAPAPPAGPARLVRRGAADHRSRRRWPRRSRSAASGSSGPTTAYALMQATGMVDDHLAAATCHRRHDEIDGMAPGPCCCQPNGTKPSGSSTTTRWS